MKNKVSILLPAYKSADVLNEVFLASLGNVPVGTELVIYDNGGNEGVKIDGGKFNNKINVVWLGDGKNIGLNAALNECFKSATGDCFYLPHTDMYMLPKCIDSLVKEANRHAPGTYLMCSRSIEKQSHIPMQLMKDFGTALSDFKKQELLNFFNEEYNDKGIVTGYRMPFFGHMKLLKNLQVYNQKNNISSGPFDESFFSFATDDDLMINCYKIGVRKFWMLQESVVYHLSGHSNKQQSVDRDDKTPYTRLCEKWKEYGITMNIDQSLQKLIPWGIKVK